VDAIIELSAVDKVYQTGKIDLHILRKVSLRVGKGSMTAIMGPSGSGKSTLMNIIGLLDRPTSGTLQIGGEAIDLEMSDAKLAALRSEKIGFIFQSFNLLPRLSALDNVLLPSVYRKKGRSDRHERARKLLAKVGLENRMTHNPTELSGGEKQRVAIARALINSPEIILADEPTGNLDSKSGGEVLNILKQLNAEGKTILIITHDPKIAAQCGSQIQILDGQIGGDHVAR